MADLAMPPPPPPPMGESSPGADAGGNASSSSSTAGHGASTARPARGDGAPPRKQSKRASAASAAAAVKAEQATGSASDAPTPAGPPYICPTCSTSYSRLEYLRRHERRHADIRPFVCECMKSFSRSDVLSRHKRQCPVALGQAEPGDIEASAPPKSAPKPRKSGGGSRKRASTASQNNGNGHAEGGRLGSPSSSRDGVPHRSATAAMARTVRDSHSGDEGEVAPREPPAHSHLHEHGSSGAGHNGSAAYPYAGVGPAALMPPVLFAPDTGAAGSGAGGPVGFGDARGPAHAYTSGIDVSAPLHAQVSALNAYASQHAYPASPESSANSTTSSPRFAARDMVRAGSGNRFSLRKGPSSLDPYARAAGGNSNGGVPAYGAEFWEALDLSAKAEAARSAAAGHSAASSASSSRSRASTNGAGVNAGVGIPGFAPNAPGQNPAFSYPAHGEYGSGSSADGTRGGAAGYPLNEDGQPPPPAPAPGGNTRGEPQRFSSVTGPLSPFSSIALTSSMSPYLSAFSNARDTPLVSSPSRGPGTPGGTGSANVFDWTMRPPSKPASQTGATAAGSQRRGSGSAHAAGTTTPSGKRKRGDDDETRTAPSSQEEPSSMDVDAAQLLETLRSLRNNGVAHPIPASGAASSSASAPVSSAELQRAAASLTAAAATSAPGAALTVSAAVDGPTEAFARETSPGPEVFLLRLQGGQQESAAGTRAPGSESTSSGAGLAAGAPLSSVAASNGGLSVSQTAVAPSPGSQALWDSLGFGNPAATPMSAGGSSLGWLMSPSIQQLINTFAVGTPGEGGSYFSGATLGSDSTTGSLATASAAPQQALPASEGPAASQTQPQQQHQQQSTAPSNITLERAFSDVKNPFYIPPDLFRACYAIPHWTLPPLTRLSMLALHSQQNLLKHFPILHEPTFRLDTTPGCLAFATCMLGCHEAGRKWWAGEEVVPYTGAGPTAIMNVPSSPDRLTRAAAAAPGKTLVDEEDGQELVKPVVMQEKTDMLMRNFAGKAKTEKDRISVVQALMLFQGNNFLASDARTRAEAARAHSKVISLARDAGFFDVKASHAQRDIDYSPEDVLRTTIGEAQGLAFSYSFLPTYLPGCSDEEKVWRRWSELASRRRTAFLIMVMDTVASLDAGTPLRIGLDELGHMPLPSPDTIWRAPYAEKWRAELDAYRGPTFDESLFDILAGDGEAGVSPGKTHPSIFGPHGPFARLVVVVALLRGILHLLEGRSAKVPTPSPLERWMEGAEQRSVAGGGRDGLDAQVDVFKRALARWRSAWDSDELCLVASGPLGRKKAGHAPPGSLRPISEGIVFTSQTASGATPLCDDALPFYWLAHVLLGHASSSSVPLPRRAAGDAEQERSHDDGEAAQQPGAPDFRSMLRFAKAFVNQGEGSPNTSSGLAAASAFIPMTP